MSKRERLYELLSEKAVQGLSDKDEAELRSLLEEDPDLDLSSLDLAAASVQLAYEGDAAQVKLPRRLRDRIEGEAAALMKARRRRVQAQATGAGKSTDGSQVIEVTLPQARPARDVWRYAGWLAAAACLALVVANFLRSQSRVTASQPREDTIASAPDVLRVELAGPGGASGSIVWSDREQKGFLHCKGLPPAGPGMQYQLWIFDATQDQATPIDGGVFEGGDAPVTVAPRLRVQKPTRFLVTVEKQGGVVVSKRERVVLEGTAK